jgi:hypothetical protein
MAELNAHAVRLPPRAPRCAARQKRIRRDVRLRTSALMRRSLGGSNLAKAQNVATMLAAGANGFVKGSARIYCKERFFPCQPATPASVGP